MTRSRRPNTDNLAVSQRLTIPKSDVAEMSEPTLIQTDGQGAPYSQAIRTSAI